MYEKDADGIERYEDERWEIVVGCMLVARKDQSVPKKRKRKEGGHKW